MQCLILYVDGPKNFKPKAPPLMNICISSTKMFLLEKVSVQDAKKHETDGDKRTS